MDFMSEKSEDAEPIPEKPEKPSHKKSRKRFLKILAVSVAVLLALPVSYAGYIYAASPEVIRKPKLEHYHFRMQILVNGKAENFGENKYQQDYAKDQCNANLPEQPIHFHDNKDQFVHIHWEGMTGGMVLKYYGWNYIGGLNKALGYKLDNLKDIQKVNTHGNFLPEIPKDAKFYIYTGDQSGYSERNFNEFTTADLEDFFGKASNFMTYKASKKTSLLDGLLPKASAHGGVDDGNDGEPGEPETEEQRLTRINNLIGNVVIFVQKDKPNDRQIKERFNKLEPLSDSTCGG